MSSRERGVLVVTVDVPLAADIASSDPRVAGTIGWLRDLLDHLQLPASWGCAEAALPVAGRFLADTPARHELALVGDAAWLGHPCGRKRFARGLDARVATARSAGAPATTLFAHHTIRRNYVDLLIKRGLSAVRGGWDPYPGAGGSPWAAHYGLWLFPASPALPRGNDRFTMRAWSALQNRSLVRLADRGGYAQWDIDLGRLLCAGTPERDAVKRTLIKAERLRSQDRLGVYNMTGWVQRHRAVRLMRPSQSILRRAA